MIKIRASSLAELFDCPARWEAKHINNMHLPASPAALLGTAIHAGTAVYDKSRCIDSAGITIDESAGAVVDILQNPPFDVDWAGVSKTEAGLIGISLHKLYCTDIAPKFWYIAVEERVNKLEITDLGIALTGTTDRIFVTKSDNKCYGVADIKTGKSAVNADGTVKTAGHAAQLAVYELLAEASTGKKMDADPQIIGLQVAKTDKGRRAGLGSIKASRELLTGSGDEPGMLGHAARILNSGNFYGNSRSILCYAKYCPIFNQCKWRR